jgi:hypothetical protein
MIYQATYFPWPALTLKSVKGIRKKRERLNKEALPIDLLFLIMFLFLILQNPGKPSPFQELKRNKEKQLKIHGHYEQNFIRFNFNMQAYSFLLLWNGRKIIIV